MPQPLQIECRRAPLRCGIGWFVALFAASGTTQGQAESAATSPAKASLAEQTASSAKDDTAATEAELDRLLHDELLINPWQVSTAVRAGAGYDDNVFLASLDPVASAFVRGELDASLWRLPTGAWEPVVFLSGTSTWFTQAPATDEQSWFLYSSMKWQPAPGWQLQGKAQAYYEDEVIDLSSTGTGRLPAQMEVTGGNAEAELHLGQSRGFWGEAAIRAERVDYQEFDEDNGNLRARLAGGWKGVAGWEFSTEASWLERFYDSREQYSPVGKAIAGTHLNLAEWHAQASATWRWQWHGKGKVTAVADSYWQRDNGVGYFDYDAPGGKLSATWEPGKWRFELEGRARRYDYRLQTVGIGIEPEHRRREEYGLRLRAERELAKAWSLFAEGEWEQSSVNAQDEGYRAARAWLGVEWRWEGGW